MAPDTLLGLLLSGLLAGAAYHRGALSGSGAAAAVFIGASVFVGGGGTWFAALCTFFLTSTLLGRVGRKRKAGPKRSFSKGDRRDFGQAIANGGTAAAAALAYGASGQPAWAGAFVGALAACNADTWATELGLLAATRPRLITTWAPVPAGTSGGITPYGLLASATGGATIGLVAGSAGPAFMPASPGAGVWLLIGGVTGLVGSLFDSFLGATAQVIYHCPECEEETERVQHGCGTRTVYARGWRWFHNDAVNLLTSIVGALTGAVLV